MVQTSRTFFYIGKLVGRTVDGFSLTYKGFTGLEGLFVGLPTFLCVNITIGLTGLEGLSSPSSLATLLNNITLPPLKVMDKLALLYPFFQVRQKHVFYCFEDK